MLMQFLKGLDRDFLYRVPFSENARSAFFAKIDGFSYAIFDSFHAKDVRRVLKENLLCLGLKPFMIQIESHALIIRGESTFHNCRIHFHIMESSEGKFDLSMTVEKVKNFSSYPRVFPSMIVFFYWMMILFIGLTFPFLKSMIYALPAPTKITSKNEGGKWEQCMKMTGTIYTET